MCVCSCVPACLYRYYLDIFPGYGCPQDILHSSSDGSTIDTAGPELSLVTIGTYQFNTTDGDTTTLYQLEYDDIPLEWDIADEDSGVANVTWMAGWTPYSSNKHPETSVMDSQIPFLAVTMQPAETVIFTIHATDFAGNQRTLISPTLTIDTTPPVIEGLHCTPYLSLLQSALHCSWLLTVDEETPVGDVAIGFGTAQLLDDLVPFTTLSLLDRQWTTILEPDVIVSTNSTTYVSLRVKNSINIEAVALAEVVIDTTPPVPGSISVVTPENHNVPLQAKLCQRSASTIVVTIQDFQDAVSGIARQVQYRLD